MDRMRACERVSGCEGQWDSENFGLKNRRPAFFHSMNFSVLLFVTF